MSSHYAEGLEILARVQERVNNIKPDAMEHSAAVEKWNALEQSWNLLRMKLIATGEDADGAVTASKRQRARYRICAHKVIRAGDFRTSQANACISHFRYVTYLSNRARAVRHLHESELLSLENLQDHYEEAPGSQTHMVHSHQIFFDTLACRIEALKRRQGLEIVYIRWNQLRAAANLTRQSREFHLTCKRLNILKKIADKACRRANRFQKKVAQSVKEYEHLETEVMNVQRAIQALQNTLFGSAERDTAVSDSLQDKNAT